MVYTHPVADVQHCQRLVRGDGPQQLVARADRIGDRDEVRVQLAGGDLVKQQPIGVRRARWWAGRGRSGGQGGA